MPFDDTIFLKTKVDILSFFDEGQLRRVTPDIERKSYSKGATVLFKGEMGTGFYIIKKGGVSAFFKPKDGPETTRTLAAGDFFGEMSLLEDASSADTIKATENDTEILVIPSASFRKLLEMQPLLKKALLDKIAARKKP